jgi:hypothetical protein
MNCRLCLSENRLTEVSGKDEREYYLCGNCSIINVSPDYFLEEDMERRHYLSHQNGIAYKGYVDFLSRAIDPALEFLNTEMSGLDYGCGYEPTLSKILAGYGYKCSNYDPLFFAAQSDSRYDFIFATEVFEHFFYPGKEIEKLTGLLSEKGLLIIMTERWRNEDQFRNWYYTRDPSHVAFYHNDTFDYICKRYAFEKLYDDNQRVIILKNISV